MTTLLKSVTTYLRDEYGIRDAAPFSGGNHPRLVFTYAGRQHTITMHNPHGGAGRGTVEMKRRDIRKLLGDPPPRPSPQPRRSLAEMTSTLSDALGPITQPNRTDPPPYAGRVSLTLSSALGNARLKITIQCDLYEAAPGLHAALLISQTATDEFQVQPHPTAQKSPHFFVEGDGYTVVSEKAVPRAGATPFGSSPAEIVMVDGHLFVRVLERRPLRGKHREPCVTVSRTNVNLTPLPTTYLETEMRAAIATIRRVETDTPYRLVRIKDADAGHWAFSAPRIE